jgi:hypothetical protein
MSVDVTTTQPTRQAIAAKPVSKATPRRVTGKLRKACMLLVHKGLTWQEAAQQTRYRASSMIYALNQSHVRAFIREQRDVLRTSMSGRNILVLAEVRDQTDNQMARVAAIKVLEGEAEQALGNKANGGGQLPGFTILIRHEDKTLVGQVVDITPERTD